MLIVVPCAGRSSRYPNLPPKWSLADQEGRPMLFRALDGLELAGHTVAVTILREHEELLDATAGIKRALGGNVEVVILEEPTRSQSETVHLTLKRTEWTSAFLVKDSDNFFNLDSLEQPFNYVCVDSLNNHDNINPRNKSYVQIDHVDRIIGIREKHVVSDLFSVGGYFFSEAAVFNEHFESLLRHADDTHPEIFLSDVIAHMLLSGHPFNIRRISAYRDWGTVKEWKQELRRQQVFVVALDGVLFEMGSLHFRPRFEDVKPRMDSVRTVVELIGQGHQVVALTVRPPQLHEITSAQLAAAGLPDLPVSYGMNSSTWSLVTRDHDSSPASAGRLISLGPQQFDTDTLHWLEQD
jgi:NDP-sugar pyrophosphorylase family protein